MRVLSGLIGFRIREYDATLAGFPAWITGWYVYRESEVLRAAPRARRFGAKAHEIRRGLFLLVASDL